MKQTTETKTELTLSEVAMVEDALKFYFEKAPTKFNQEKTLWADTYKKVVMLKDEAIEAYKQERGLSY